MQGNDGGLHSVGVVCSTRYRDETKAWALGRRARLAIGGCSPPLFLSRIRPPAILVEGPPKAGNDTKAVFRVHACCGRRETSVAQTHDFISRRFDH